MLRWEVTLLEKLPGLSESRVLPSEPPPGGGLLDDVSDDTELREALGSELNPLPSAEPEAKSPRSQGLEKSSFTPSSSLFSS